MQQLSHTSWAVSLFSAYVHSACIYSVMQAKDVHKLWCHTWRQSVGSLKHSIMLYVRVWCSTKASHWIWLCFLRVRVCVCVWWLFTFNPVFVWEECLEMSGSLKRLIPTRNMGTAVKCWHQQLEGSGGDRWEVVWGGGGGGVTGYYWLIKHKHLTVTNQGLQTFNTNDTCFIQNALLLRLSTTVCFWLYKKFFLKAVALLLHQNHEQQFRLNRRNCVSLEMTFSVLNKY